MPPKVRRGAKVVTNRYEGRVRCLPNWGESERWSSTKQGSFDQPLLGEDKTSPKERRGAKSNSQRGEVRENRRVSTNRYKGRVRRLPNWGIQKEFNKARCLPKRGEALRATVIEAKFEKAGEFQLTATRGGEDFSQSEESKRWSSTKEGRFDQLLIGRGG